MKKILSLILVFSMISLVGCKALKTIDIFSSAENITDIHIGRWVWGEEYDDCFEREIIIHSISENKVNFDIMYYRLWSFANVEAEVDSDNKALFLTEDGVEGNFYISNNQLKLTITQSTIDNIKKDSKTYAKDAGVENISDESISEGNSPNEQFEEIVNTKIPYEAICGAIIIGEDSVGNNYYIRKCEKCNWVSDTLLLIGPSYEFYCPDCYNAQTVRIIHNENATSESGEKKYKQYCYYTASRNTIILSQSPYPGECKYKVQCEKCGTLSVNTYTFGGYNSYGYDSNWHRCEICGNNTCGYVDVRTKAVED